MNDEKDDFKKTELIRSEDEDQETSVVEEAASQAIDPMNLGEIAIKVITSVIDNFDI